MQSPLKLIRLCAREGETQEQCEGILIQKCIYKFLDQV